MSGSSLYFRDYPLKKRHLEPTKPTSPKARFVSAWHSQPGSHKASWEVITGINRNEGRKVR